MPEVSITDFKIRHRAKTVWYWYKTDIGKLCHGKRIGDYLWGFGGNPNSTDVDKKICKRGCHKN